MKTYLECPNCGNTSWQRSYRVVVNPYKVVQLLQCTMCHQVCAEGEVSGEIDTDDNEKGKPLTPSPFIKLHRINRNNNPRPVYINYNYITRIVPIDDSNDYHSSISMMNYPEWQDFRLMETAEEIIEKIKEAGDD